MTHTPCTMCTMMAPADWLLLIGSWWLGSLCTIGMRSRKKDIFMFGCENSTGISERIFPKLCDQCGRSFNFDSCCFKVQKSRGSCARINVWRECNLQQSYTLEVRRGSGAMRFSVPRAPILVARVALLPRPLPLLSQLPPMIAYSCSFPSLHTWTSVAAFGHI